MIRETMKRHVFQQNRRISKKYGMSPVYWVDKTTRVFRVWPTNPRGGGANLWIWEKGWKERIAYCCY